MIVYHLIGIGGSGMSGLARVLLAQGYGVSGSDQSDSATLRSLESAGAVVTVGHRPENLSLHPAGPAGVVVFSAAIRGDSPELAEAERRGLRVISRAALLGEILNRSRGIAIAGTHGKTTTTAMTAAIFLAAHLDPTVLVGGDWAPLGGNARVGAGPHVIAEACEAYGSFLELHPFGAVVTNLEADHLDWYPDLAAVQRAFSTFLSQLNPEGWVAVEGSGAALVNLARSSGRRVITFGVAEPESTAPWDYSATDLDWVNGCANYQLVRRGERLGRVQLAAPGRHNLLNSLGAAAAALEEGAGMEAVQSALAAFTGVGRRFERLYTHPSVQVVDDYAHHPTEVRAVLAAARATWPGRLAVVFQPHLYSRTQQLLAEFGESFDGADDLWIAPIYGAREMPIPGVTSELLESAIRNHQPMARLHPAANREALVCELEQEARKAIAGVGSPTLILTAGAGDIRQVGEAVVRRLMNKTETRMRQRVAVLMGGRSAEREVSLSTGKQVLAALDPSRYDAYAVDTAWLESDAGTGDAADDLPLRVMRELIGERRPDVALLCLHGTHGEDGTIQGLLELLHIPYTGSGVLASALAMDKAMAKVVLGAAGIDCPAGIILRGAAEIAVALSDPEWLGAAPLPCVVKPNAQGSTIGTTIVRDRSDLPAAVRLASKHDADVLIETFIEGVEITGPVLGDVCLPLVEIVPGSGFYDYEAKYTPGATEEICPARLTEAQTAAAKELALKSHRVLGCRGYSRVDMMVTADRIWVLEVNTIPGMTPTSLLPRSAETAGIPFASLVERLIQQALENPSSGTRRLPTTANA